VHGAAAIVDELGDARDADGRGWHDGLLMELVAPREAAPGPPRN
jgi:hypothetical protein